MLKGGAGRHAAVFLDFAPLRKQQCRSDQFEKWYARTAKDKACVMGHKVRSTQAFTQTFLNKQVQQWYNRKIPDADCFVGEKFTDPVEHEENCPCDDDDYEWCVAFLSSLCSIDPHVYLKPSDFNFVRSGDQCIALGPEPIPLGVCQDMKPGDTYLGSSGYRLIPGNTCNPGTGTKKDDPIRKDCGQGAFFDFCFCAMLRLGLAQLPEGGITHQTVGNRPLRSLVAELINLTYSLSSHRS